MSETGAGRHEAERYRAARDIAPDGLHAWRDAIAKEAALGPRDVIVDVGAGTGAFATAFREWFGVRVVAVEPAEAMRALIPRVGGIDVLDGTAERLPLTDESADAAWLGSVLHHLQDISVAARELRRVLKPGAPVLIRNTFPGRAADDLRVQFFPATARTIDGYPSVDAVCSAFEAAGLRRVALERLPHAAAPTLAEFAARLNRASDSKLRALSDADFEAGMTRLRSEAASDPTAPATSWMDLLVLR
jgi:ubiquinone/menaquinone biosynthesis C-methylase UbiE